MSIGSFIAGFVACIVAIVLLVVYVVYKVDTDMEEEEAEYWEDGY